MVGEDHLKTIATNLSRQPHYLENSRRKPGRLIKKWNLVVPVELLEPRWEGKWYVFPRSWRGGFKYQLGGY
jgi:hypothetical protein